MYISELSIYGTLAAQEAEEAATKLAREVLSNPVIEDYRVEIEA